VNLVSVLDLAPTTASVPTARRFARAALSECTADVETVVLLVSEVVTNAVLHARSDIRLVVEDRDDVARVEVHDGSPMLPRMHSFRRVAATGRGLRLLDTLAQAWGVEVTSEAGKVVWFEVGSADDVLWKSFDLAEESSDV